MIELAKTLKHKRLSLFPDTSTILNSDNFGGFNNGSNSDNKWTTFWLSNYEIKIKNNVMFNIIAYQSYKLRLFLVMIPDLYIKVWLLTTILDIANLSIFMS